MKTYLVLIRSGFDDLPLFVTTELQQAVLFAKGVDLDNCPAIDAAEKVFGIIAGIVDSVSIATFTDGVLTACDLVKDFDAVEA